MSYILRRIPLSNHYSYRNCLLYYYKSYYCLSVEPQTCLHDVPVSIRAEGLKPNENVTISATTSNDKGEKYFSYAYYKADSLGCVDLENQNSLGGAYKGCLPMGLMSTLQNVQLEKKYQMFLMRNAENSLQLNLNLMRGFMGRQKCATATVSDYETSILHERHYMAKGTTRVAIKEGRIRGTLFLPPGKGPFPAVIDMYGTNGGLREIRAAQLSSHGFATLALAFFRYDDLPQIPDVIDIEYFEEATHYLLQHERISSDGIGVLGSSLGSELALAMGIFLKEVKAVVAIGGVPAVTFWPIKYKNIYFPAIEPDLSKLKPGYDVILTKDMLGDDCSDRPESLLPLEKINGNVLFLIGKDDQNWHSLKETRNAVERMRQHGLSNYEVMECDGTGHMIEPPFSQFCDRIYHIMPKDYMFMGGQLKEHTIEEPKAWLKAINFLKSNLCR